MFGSSDKPKMKNIVIHNYVVSETHGNKLEVKSDLSGRGGVFKQWKQAPEMISRGYMNTTSFDYQIKILNISTVDFAIIDVEGHEVEVILGMNLEKNYMSFPMLQVELGGTWVDDRHTSIWRQGDMARYLSSIGYSIYLMGWDWEKTQQPCLLKIHPNIFDDGFFLRGDGQRDNRFYVQGNLLAIYHEYVREPFRLSIQSSIDQMEQFIWKMYNLSGKIW